METAVPAGRPCPELGRRFHQLLYVPLGSALVPRLLGASGSVWAY
ncbi:hypothetical protein [Streptomyces sp. NPDC004629]